MSHLEMRPGFLDRVKALHGIRSDAALASAVGVSYRTLVRVKADPKAVQPMTIAGFCTVFGYSPSDVVEAVDDTVQLKRTA